MNEDDRFVLTHVAASGIARLCHSRKDVRDLPAMGTIVGTRDTPSKPSSILSLSRSICTRPEPGPRIGETLVIEINRICVASTSPRP